MNICFIGLGKLGLPCAEVIAQKGHNVSGYDINVVSSDLVNVYGSIKEAAVGADIVFIAVPTPHDPLYDGKEPTSHLEPKDFNYDIVKSALREVIAETDENTLVVLISTVLPGTVKREFKEIIGTRKFAYNPYLIAMGTVAYDMVNPEMVIIGLENVADISTHGKDLVDFYKSIMENEPRYEIGTWEEAESIKIFYNTFISAKLSLVNMIQDVAMRIGNMNVDVVTDALANSTYRIMGKKYMTAGLGDGGACHPRDNIALRNMACELGLGYDLFHAIMDAREKQAKNMADYLVSFNMPVVIVGKSYKPGVTYSAGSVSILTGEFVKQATGKVYYHDTDDCDDTRDSEIFDFSKPAVYLMTHSNYITYDGKADTVCQIPFATGSVIVDPWRKQSDIPGCTVIHYGNTREQ